MTFELAITWIDIVSLIISILTLIGLGIYAYFTWLIAKDTQEIFISFTIQQTIQQTQNQPNTPKVSPSHISFGAVNRTKFEVEVFGKVWTKIDNQIFEFKKGFYAYDTNMLIQPFMTGGGGFDLNDLENKQGINLGTFVKENNISSIKFYTKIKYRKVGTKKFKIASTQPYHYDFKTHKFWWNV